ncbi:AraC family transcriptional regulator [Jiella sonneratiae]|uniref:AraC family transcriptional regulator n=1 Tax=Jiella sonneratiae TaxID=2816856 RepID=A0ABS3J5V8_9HYPH|nr:AraC family transcriptional regulator [Jiella sonneratiae]MBO0904525.1 AraC family transcriptional regulator [Jiella sonneratiae]
MSLAATPELLTRNPRTGVVGDLLSEALRRVRITGSMQYCFMPSGEWATDASPAPYKPRDSIGFHIVAGGTCWLEFEGERTTLVEGDIAAFPFGTGHAIGVGDGGPLIDPGRDLPPGPWGEVPVLRYGRGAHELRMLCGYIQCEAMDFLPFRNVLPTFIHVRTLGSTHDDWLAQTIRQIVIEVDNPIRGGGSVLERLTEVTFLEVLRRQFLPEDVQGSGWLAAVHDPALGRCLSLIHAEPTRDWTVIELARASGLSRSALAEHFAGCLGISPIRYLRDWRLYLASLRLRHSVDAIVVIAQEAGYGTEAAFNRAFAKRFGIPPAEWRRTQSALGASGASAVRAAAPRSASVRIAKTTARRP